MNTELAQGNERVEEVSKRFRELLEENSDITELHLYLDFSGDANAETHRPAITALIDVAKEHGLNFGFSSFAHYCSPRTQISITDRSAEDAWRKIADMENASGGTDFAGVWTDIQYTPQQEENRINVMLTDFWWTPSVADAQRMLPHPSNLYYAPSTKSSDTKGVMQPARIFARSMRDFQIEPNILQRIIGLPDLNLDYLG